MNGSATASPVEQNISSEQLTLLTALTRWRMALSHPVPSERLDVIVYLDVMGFIPDDHPLTDLNVNAPAFAIDAVVRHAEERMMRDASFLKQLLTGDLSVLKRDLAPLPEAAVSALREIILHQHAVDQLDLTGLNVRFPFEVKDLGYFNLFLHSHERDPGRAYRHLTSCQSIFHRIRDLIECIADPTLGVAVATLDVPQQDTYAWYRTKNAETKDTENQLLDILTSCIEIAPQFYGMRNGGPEKMVTVTLPPLPEIIVHRDSVDLRHHIDLGYDLADWLVQGKVSGAALNWAPRAGGGKRAQKKFSDEYPSVLQQLTAIPKLKTSIAEFRTELKAAAATGAKIVLVNGSESGGASVVAHLLLAAQAERTAGDVKPRGGGIDVLKDAGYLLRSGAANNRYFAMSETDNLMARVQNFHFPKAELSPSLMRILRPVLPKGVRTEQQAFRSELLKVCQLPGIEGDFGSRHFARMCERTFPEGATMAQDFEVVLHHAPFFSHEQLTSVLKLLRKYGVHEVTDRSVYLLEEKFHLDTDLLAKFDRYCAYQPRKVGEIPPLFEDFASFERYSTIGLGAAGVRREVEELEALLAKHNVVAVVDGTSYHPEFIQEIGGEKIQVDKERSGEQWGQYVRPGMRVIQSLTQRIVEGESEFRNCSVICTKEQAKLDKALEKLYMKFLAVEIGVTPDLSEINQVLTDINTYDDSAIVIIDAESIKELKQLSLLLRILDENRFKVVVRAREAIPGIPHVLLMPWSDSQVHARLVAEGDKVGQELGLSAPIDPDIIRFATRQIRSFRVPSGDPLNFALVTLQVASNHARAHHATELVLKDVITALPAVFHLPDLERTRRAIATIEEFLVEAPDELLGQQEPIARIGRGVISHIAGTRDPARPLSMMMPGPTGVGKTELVEKLALAAGIPFMKIQGSRFSEAHTVSSLLGSPSGYVGPDEGPLYKFVDENVLGIVFFDEYEKMHPAVYKAVMDFIDKGILTAGNGRSTCRPGIMIFAATNAGASRLTRRMSSAEVRETLSVDFKDQNGVSRPELLARWDVVPMTAIAREDFRRVVQKTVHSLGARYGFVSANLRLDSIDDVAFEMLYDKSREVCAFHSSEKLPTGFRISQPSSNGHAVSVGDLYHDMRFVHRAYDMLVQDSVTEVVIAQHTSGRSRNRGETLPMRLVGDREKGRIIMLPAV